MRTILLALLLPLAVDAQIALFAMNGSIEVPIGAVLDLGKVAAGDTLSVRIRVRNIGAIPASIGYFAVEGDGFTLDRPALPFPVGQVQDVLLNFSKSTPGRVTPPIFEWTAM